jgi:HSP20 family protein
MAISTYRTTWRRGWDPFQELGRLQNELDQRFEVSGLGRPFLAREERRFPLINLVTNDEETVLFAELPGVELKDLEITLTGTSLTLKGERKADKPVPEEKYFRRERGAGPFGRTVELPHRIAADQVEAAFTNGILKIRLPKATEAQPRRIEVKA